jgi:signal transduction histidine kinase
MALPPGEVIGKNPRIINSRLQPSSFYREMWQQLTDRSIGTWSAELINRKKNGELVRVWQTITTIRGKDGTIQGYLGQTRDMTEIHSVRRQLKRQNEELGELSRFKGEMVEIMAHDLKAPLQSVIGFTELAKTRLGDSPSPELKINIERIGQAGKNMLEMIQNFLQLQRSESGELTVEKERGNLRSLVRALVEGQNVVGLARDVEVIFEEEGPARPQYFDPVRMEQAINNVISNAVKYTSVPSQIVVRFISREGFPERIEVDDEGEGIPEEELENVFEAYQQVKNKKKGSGSVGWGLAIARKVLELHGGKIWVENRKSGGCRFIMELCLGYECFGEIQGAVLLHDPEESWCRHVLDELEKWGHTPLLFQEVGRN